MSATQSRIEVMRPVSYVAVARNLTLHALRVTRREFIRSTPPLLRLQPWAPVTDEAVPDGGAWCVVCRWRGDSFKGIEHSESAVCPRCRSIARDRFLHLSLLQRVPYRRELRVLEMSPRLGRGYQRAMRRRVDYITSDYDERWHRGKLKLNLEKLDLPDGSIDVLLTAHVLEHVPDTDAALAEIFRVLRPSGNLLLQVPLLQTATAPPVEPEFHEDNSPVFWRFGLDLTQRLRSQGFTTTLLVTEELHHRVVTRNAPPPGWVSAEADAAGLVMHADLADLTPVASQKVARRTGLAPWYLFAAWHCVKP
jgi:SAM-dependent methyltransferase